MNKTIRRTISLLILTTLALLLAGCADTLANPPGSAANPGSDGSADPNYTYSQATIDAGQRQLLDLAIRATEIKLNMDQAEDAAALSTLEYAQRQKLEVDFQATLVSQNMANAAATQEFLAQQTNVAMEATAVAQSNEATVTQLAFQVMGTQTVQAQVILDARVQQTAEAVAELTAYPLTATPLAVTQAALLMQQYDREQQSFLDKVVKPFLPFAAVILLLLFMAMVVFANRRARKPMPWFPRLRDRRETEPSKQMRIIDGVEIYPNRLNNKSFQPEGTSPDTSNMSEDNPAHIEIVNANEPPFFYWINEAEGRLGAEGKQQP